MRAIVDVISSEIRYIRVAVMKQRIESLFDPLCQLLYERKTTGSAISSLPIYTLPL